MNLEDECDVLTGVGGGSLDAGALLCTCRNAKQADPAGTSGLFNFPPTSWGRKAFCLISGFILS